MTTTLLIYNTSINASISITASGTNGLGVLVGAATNSSVMFYNITENLILPSQNINMSALIGYVFVNGVNVNINASLITVNLILKCIVVFDSTAYGIYTNFTQVECVPTTCTSGFWSRPTSACVTSCGYVNTSSTVYTGVSTCESSSD